MRIPKQGLRRHAKDSISVDSGAPSAMLEERLWGSHNRKPGSPPHSSRCMVERRELRAETRKGGAGTLVGRPEKRVRDRPDQS